MAHDEWGIEDGYFDIAGSWHDAPDATRRALRVAMGGLSDVADPPPTSRPVWFVRHGSAPAIERPAELVLEDGESIEATTELPPDLPLGYHDLPELLTLVFWDRQLVERDCRIVWRSNRSIGVQFTSQPKPAPSK